MKHKILIIGNFGDGTPQSLNGQTMRTRSVLSIVRNDGNFEAEVINTKNKWELIKLLPLYFMSSKIIIMPAQKAIGFLLNVLTKLDRIKKKETHLVAIGGWLPDYLSNKTEILYALQRMKKIYVQTGEIEEKLKKSGLNNVIHFPNFRLYQDEPNENKKSNSDLRLVCYSRITEDKGITMAIDAVLNLKDSPIEKLDIYGPISGEYEKEFKALIQKSSKINYKGIISPDKVLSILSQYDLTLFPTYYVGEGFPGTLLDSISAGVPVLASDWKYNGNIISENYNGWLFETKKQKSLEEKLIYILNNGQKLNAMRQNCFESSNRFSAETISKILLDQLRR